MKAKIRDIIPMGQESVLTLSVGSPAGDYEEMVGKDLELVLRPYRGLRSLDANAYFHVLCDRLRQKLGMTMAECKNHLISSYGQVWYVDDVPIIYKTNAPPEVMIQQEEPHTWLVKTNEEGQYFYRVYRGTHTYDTAEMSKLIDGTIQECKAQGIETATPDELAKMMSAWETKYGKRSKEAG